jgi:hypothetical protein
MNNQRFISVSLFGLVVAVGWFGAVRSRAQDQASKPPTLSANIGQVTAGPTREVDLSALPAAPAFRQGPVREIPKGMPFSASQYAAMKDQVAERIRTTSPEFDITRAGAPELFPPDTPGTSKGFFPPHTADQTQFCNGFIPSDMAVTASSGFLVQVTNSCITVLNVSSGVAFSGFPKSLDAFFGVPGTNLVGDPRALYDPAPGRFIVVAEDFTTNIVYIATSRTSNPTGLWFVTSFFMNFACKGGGDFPMIGQTLQENGDAAGALYVSWDEFCPNGSVTNDVLAIPKTHMYNGTVTGAFLFNNFAVNGVKVDHVQPVNVMNKGDRPRAEFLINSFDFNFGGGSCFLGCNGLVVWAIHNGIPPAGQLASFSGKVVATPSNYSLPPHAQQPGCSSGSCLLDTGTPGITGMVNYSSGRIWATINTAGSIGCDILAWQVAPSLDDSGVINGATVVRENRYVANGSAYYGTIQPDSEDNYTMAFQFSSSGTYPGIAYLSTRVTQLPGSGFFGFHDTGIFLTAGQGFYKQLDNFGRNRWGDYTGTAYSQTVPNAYWFSGQYSTSTGHWATAIGRNGYTSLTQP